MLKRLAALWRGFLREYRYHRANRRRYAPQTSHWHAFTFALRWMRAWS